MPKKFKEKKVKERRGIKAGDTYEYNVDIEVADVTGDGLKDLVVEHSVTNMNTGMKVPKSTTVWEGLDEPTIVGFEEAFEKAGIVEGTQTFTKFKDVVKEWRKITKALHNINDLGDKVAAEELGEL